MLNVSVFNITGTIIRDGIYVLYGRLFLVSLILNLGFILNLDNFRVNDNLWRISM